MWLLDDGTKRAIRPELGPLIGLLSGLAFLTPLGTVTQISRKRARELIPPRHRGVDQFRAASLVTGYHIAVSGVSEDEAED